MESFEQVFEPVAGVTSTPTPATHSLTTQVRGRTGRDVSVSQQSVAVTRSEEQMRRYDDLVEVRRGMVAGTRGQTEGPAQFLWRGRLWKVFDVLAQWVETAPWWQPDQSDQSSRTGAGAGDLLHEREVWRVEAAPGRLAREGSGGVFDLAFDWSQGTWTLARCLD